MKYRKKPVVIEAVQWTGENLKEMRYFTGKPLLFFDSHSRSFIIETLEGDMVASVGDYIIKGVQGEFYPCKPDIFEATYEEADNGKDK